jgi:hypothetical protein
MRFYRSVIDSAGRLSVDSAMNTFITTILFTQALTGAPAAKILDAEIKDTQAQKGGTRIFLNRGAFQGVELGDQGQLMDGSQVVTRFTIDNVGVDSSSAYVPVREWEVENLGKKAKIELTPGSTPPTLKRKEQAEGPLGSCDSNYRMYKAGRIHSWTPRPDGSVRHLWIDDLGWKQRVCKDSTGMIYQGGVGDQFVTDGDNVKIRLRVVDLGYGRSFVEVIQGKLDEKLLKDNDKVVFRAKK